MAKWFGNKRNADVPEDWARALEKALAPIKQQHPQWPSQIAEFVTTGSPASILTDIVGNYALTGVLHLWHANPMAGNLAEFRAVSAGLGEVPTDVALRYARFLEAAGQGSGMIHGQGRSDLWRDALVQQAFTLHGSQQTAQRVPVDIMLLERLTEATGAPAHDVLLMGFRTAHQHARGPGVGRALELFEGYDDAVRRHAEQVRLHLSTSSVDLRLIAFGALDKVRDETLALFAGELAEQATSTSSKVRSACLPLLARCGAAAIAPLREIATAGKPEARLHALRLLWQIGDGEVTAWVRERAAEDRAANVRALLDEWDRAEEPEGPEEPEVEVPDIDWRSPVTTEMRAQLAGHLARVNKQIDASNAHIRSMSAQLKARSIFYATDQPRVEKSWLDGVLAALEASRPPAPSIAVEGRPYFGHGLQGMLAEMGLGPAGLLILLSHTTQLTDHRGGLSDVAAEAFNQLHRTRGKPSLLEVSTMLDQMGLDGGKLVLLNYAKSWGYRLGRDWPDEEVASFMRRHLDKVLALLTPGERDYWTDPLAAFIALRTLRPLPPSVVDALFATALGSRKTERGPAQDALAEVPGLEARVITALSDGKGDVRAQAAIWLGRLRHEPAIPALEVAVRKEKQDVAMGAMLDALQAMGQPVEKYLDRDALAGQAAAAVAKGLPKDLDWFPWAGLPQLRWADSGEQLPLTTIQWFVAQAVRAKSAEPNAVLRKYCAMLDATDREPFGQFLLEAWIVQDLVPIDPTTARKQAETTAAQIHQGIQRWPDYYKDSPFLNATVEQITAAYLPAHLKQPVGSAVSSKGVLAVAAACAGERAAPVVQRYLKEWYGLRASQGRALIAMLGWIEHPSATQLMLSVGSRFRTKSFQDEATRQAEALAERKGWTLGELADRTIPTAGFDESGVLELSYGERVFTARLLPDLTISLHAPDGKKIGSLPAPRQTDDEAAVKGSKKSLAAARKELKSVVQLQTERFYEALCTERTWAFEDWELYLNHHPVMRHLTQRLAWSAQTGGGAVSFRPLDDGTLTDLADEEVTLPGDARVGVAHDSNVGPDVDAWRAHFADYEVAPLFQQFGKGTFELPDDRANTQEVSDFLGHLVEAFSLRGRAGKLGYTRGAAQDAGWFYTYEKRFPTLGISAIVEFSGNPLPEENRTVALSKLSFQRHGPEGAGAAGTLRLQDVPSVLLSEAYNDLRLMASDGTGFAPDWQKKVEY